MCTFDPVSKYHRLYPHVAGQHWRAARHTAGLAGGAGRPGDGDVRNRSVRPLRSRRRRDLLYDLHRPGRQGRWHCGPLVCVWTGTIFHLAFICLFVFNEFEWMNLLSCGSALPEPCTSQASPSQWPRCWACRASGWCGECLRRCCWPCWESTWPVSSGSWGSSCCCWLCWPSPRWTLSLGLSCTSTQVKLRSSETQPRDGWVQERGINQDKCFVSLF